METACGEGLSVRTGPFFPFQEIPKKHQPAPAKAEEPLRTLPEKKKFRHRPEPLFIPPPPSYPANPAAASYSGATLYQSQLRSPRVLGEHLLLDPAHELPPYTPPPMLSPVRQGSGLFSNVLISGHGPGAHPQLPLTPLTPTPRVLLCRSSESPPPLGAWPCRVPAAAGGAPFLPWGRVYPTSFCRGPAPCSTPWAGCQRQNKCAVLTLKAIPVQLGRPQSRDYGLFGLSGWFKCAHAA